MYYSDMSRSVVVRGHGGVLKVGGPAMLYLPVLSTLSSCAAYPASSSSAGVGDLSLVYMVGEGDTSVSVPHGDLLAGVTHNVKGFYFLCTRSFPPRSERKKLIPQAHDASNITHIGAY